MRRDRGSDYPSPTATGGSSPPRTRCACSRPRGAWCSAMCPPPRPRRFSPIPTDPPTTSRGSRTRPAPWSASCRTRSGSPKACSAPPTASASSPRSRPGSRGHPRLTSRADEHRQAQPQRGRILRQVRRRAAAEAAGHRRKGGRGSRAEIALHEVPQGRLRPLEQPVSRGADRDLSPLRRHVARRRRARGRGARAPAGAPDPCPLRRVQGAPARAPGQEAGQAGARSGQPAGLRADVTSFAAPPGPTDAASFPGERPVTPEVVREHHLNDLEYGRIVDMLGRTPTLTELGVFSALWSEHCSYKHSKPVLKRFPTTGPQVVQGPGENAGVLRLPDGWAVAFKIESHNHPSAVEPYQGAATGVGGILRDVFTMGARPVAVLNSLRFGPLDHPRNRYLFAGVVRGVGDYGNCVGIPTLGGEVGFASGYTGNPLVNAMCVGLLKESDLIRAAAHGVGNVLLCVGSRTGRDGIHGASFASEELSEKSEARRPQVQVGD